MKPDRPIRLAFLLLPQFSMMAFSAALEPLRAANRLAGSQLYDWRLVSNDGQAVTASNGIAIAVNNSRDTLEQPDLLVACVGLEPLDASANASLRGWLRHLAGHGCQVGGVSGGAFLLAEAGLLDPALRRLARCTACNEAPYEVTVADLRAAQSARMPASATAVTRCPRCRRVAWRGTQFDRIEAELTGLGIAGPGSFRCTTPSRPTGVLAAGVSG